MSFLKFFSILFGCLFTCIKTKIELGKDAGVLVDIDKALQHLESSTSSHSGDAESHPDIQAIEEFRKKIFPTSGVLEKAKEEIKRRKHYYFIIRQQYHVELEKCQRFQKGASCKNAKILHLKIQIYQLRTEVYHPAAYLQVKPLMDIIKLTYPERYRADQYYRVAWDQTKALMEKIESLQQVISTKYKDTLSPYLYK